MARHPAIGPSIRLALILGLAVPAPPATAAEPAFLLPDEIQPTGVAAPVARGVIEAERRAVLASQMAGRIVNLPFRRGDRFAVGKTLIAFDCALYEADLAAAEAGLAAARSQLESQQALAELAAAGTLELHLAAAEVERAKAARARQRALVGQCRIVAPFAGQVADVLVHAYESVAPGQPLLEVFDPGSLEITLRVPSLWLRWLRPGAPFAFAIDETGTSRPARIIRLGAKVDATSQMIQVTARFEAMPARRSGPSTDGGPGTLALLLPGMSGTALDLQPPPTN